MNLTIHPVTPERTASSWVRRKAEEERVVGYARRRQRREVPCLGVVRLRGGGIGFPLYSLGRERLLGHLDQRGERLVVRDGELSQHSAVDLDTGRLQSLDEPVVRHTVRPGPSVDALNPEPPERALA